MAGYNRLAASTRLPASGPLRTVSATPDAVTHEGAPGFQRDARSELFLRATTRFAGEKAFYETADQGVERLRELVAQLAVDDETWPWVRVFLSWLRGPGNVRTASILLAAEAVHARLAAGLRGEGNRELITSVLQRPDEPGELLAYWKHRWGVVLPDGRTQVHLPKPVKRGVADAVNRLYNEAAFLRYDGEGNAIRFGDVLELTHAKGDFTGAARFTAPTDEVRDAPPRTWQDELFAWSITARHGRAGAAPHGSLTAVRARWELNRLPAELRHMLGSLALSATHDDWEDEATAADLRRLEAATVGQWEWLLSWLGERPAANGLSKADQWRLVIDKIGYMALLRNLRNLDEAGVSDAVAQKAMARLADAEQVRKSRQLPFRFWSAYREARSLRWSYPLEQALGHSLANVPELAGRTLVLIDTSQSMVANKLSGRSTMDAATAAAIFGLALKIRNPAGVDAWGFANGQFHVTGVEPGTSLLRAVAAFTRHVGSVGGGTEIAKAVRETRRDDHRRVIILTDMQTFDNPRYAYHIGDVDAAAPRDVPIYAWNVVGYANTAMPVRPGNNRHELGGLTDAAFRLPALLEARQAGRWPWEL